MFASEIADTVERFNGTRNVKIQTIVGNAASVGFRVVFRLEKNAIAASVIAPAQRSQDPQMQSPRIILRYPFTANRLGFHALKHEFAGQLRQVLATPLER